MRLVDADALKDKVNDSDYVPTWKWVSLSDLEALPAIKPIKWNLCEKEMPLCMGAYLVTVIEKYSFEKEWRYHVDIGYAFGDEIDNFWDTCNDWNEGQEIHVIAWSSLPEPYEPTKEKNL